MKREVWARYMPNFKSLASRATLRVRVKEACL